jgi:ABC-type enterobactin transport system permease subunit
VQLKVNDKKQSLASAAAVGGVVLVLIVFLLGKRSGRKKSTFVEIRRV